MSFAIQDVEKVIESEWSARIYAISKRPAIGAREQPVPEDLVHEQTLSGGLDEYPSG